MLLDIADRQSHLDAILASVHFGDVYAGARPTDIAGISLGTLLGTVIFNATPFGATSSSGVATANATTPGTGVAAGDASYIVCYKADHTTIQCVIGAGNAADAKEAVFNNKTIAISGTISPTSITISWAVGTI